LKKQIFGAIGFTQISKSCKSKEKQKIANEIAKYLSSSPKLNFIFFDRIFYEDVHLTKICKSLKNLPNLQYLDNIILP
jgi:hypothetical protein